MSKKEKQTGKLVKVITTAAGIKIISAGDEKVLVDLENDDIRPVLGLVSILIDEAIPALLEKQYVVRDDQWKLQMCVSLKPDDMFSGEW
jgi:hypothetical protein